MVDSQRPGHHVNWESTIKAAAAAPVQHDAVLVLIAGLLLATGVAASLAAARIRLPALVVFLGIGMAIGTDGLGWIDFDDYGLARSIGTVALVLILYEGGVDTGFGTIRPVLRSAASLA